MVSSKEEAIFSKLHDYHAIWCYWYSDILCHHLLWYVLVSTVISSYLPQKVLDSRSVPEMERLSTLYNADVGLYMLANKA
ncbi:Inositol phosphorylceramide glucuronosyltransferase 1 [Camellia lanceoleosa]|uniref:Inositol phosphorylceramide glucuronosyltransferase 1 n=1 Tax=Camellia lanceoleosa TaxID=1840588 RepID=A0ACC0FJ59_9ERIC|nr:Inositol phosphorylceramide glucuronosyltransferase 1 [Camellia lanceoleosa]